MIGAYIVPRDPAAPPATEALLAYAAARLAPYKTPREIILIPALPRTTNGKVKRANLGAVTPLSVVVR